MLGIAIGVDAQVVTEGQCGGDEHAVPRLAFS
jgi:hypothetical protein